MSKRIQLTGILLLAAAMRFTGIGFGTYHPDEHLVIHHALAFGSGDLNPHMFYYPSFHLYQLFLMDLVYYAIGHLAGTFQDPGEFLKQFTLDPLPIYTLNRALSALYGTLTVWVLFKAGKRYGGVACGLWASFMLALNFLHGRDSHFATVDVPMTFFMMASFYQILRSLDSKNPRSLYWASLLAGLGVSVKYNAFLMGLPIAVACFAVGSPWAIMPCALVASLAFCLGSPFFVLDFQHAIGFLIHLKQINAGFHISWKYPFWVLGQGMGWSWLVIGLASFFLPVASRIKKIVLAVFLVAYGLMIIRAGQPFERYAQPLIPFLCLSAAGGISWLLGSLADPGFRKKTAVAIFFAVLLSSAKSFYSDVLFLRKDTRDMAKVWVHRNIPDGSVIAIDDSMQSPRLIPTADQIRHKILELNPEKDPSGSKRKRLDSLLGGGSYPSPSYDLYYLSETRNDGGFSFYGPMIDYSEQALADAGVNYLLSNHLSEARRPFFYKALTSGWKPVADFHAGRSAAGPIAMDTWTYLPIDGRLWNYERPGPDITLYERIQ